MIKLCTQNTQNLTETVPLKQPSLLLIREGPEQSPGSTQVRLLGKRACNSRKVALLNWMFANTQQKPTGEVKAVS